MPRDAQVWKALGVAYAASGDYRGAAPAFKQSCDLDPRLLDACFYLGQAYYAADQYEPAITAFRKGLPFDAKPWRMRLGIAKALEALGRSEQAEKEFMAAVRESDKAGESAPVAYAVFLIRQGRPSDAIAPLSNALKRFPNSASANLEMGRALLELGRTDEAVRYLKISVKTDPSSTQAHVLLGKAYARLGRDREAQQQFEAARQGSLTEK
jgi:tetratricopeptide (TPR) repeat protein